MGEYNGTFNPDGTEFYYTVSNIHYDVLVITQMQENQVWSKPEVVSFAAPHPEFDPIFSPDGNTLYFSSHRPIDETGSTDASNIWKIVRTGKTWGESIHVPLYGPSRGNYFSSITNEGEIYFNIWNTGDLFKAVPVDTGYVVEKLGDVVNSPQGDGDLFVAPDGSYIIFRSYRSGGFGNGDLWISFLVEGAWQEPVNLGEPINSSYNEMCPYVTVDGELFIFSSSRFTEGYYDSNWKDLTQVKQKLESWDNGQQNIYVMSAGFIEELRSL